MNIEIEINNIYNQKLDYDNKINEFKNEFITNANRLVKLSDDLYQIEATITLNKISLKDYILNSEVVLLLKENNILNYTTEILSSYMDKFKENSLIDGIDKYKLALELYIDLEKIEKIENDKIKIIQNGLSRIFPIIKSINKENYKEIIDNIKLKNRNDLIKYRNNNTRENLKILFEDIDRFYYEFSREF